MDKTFICFPGWNFGAQFHVARIFHRLFQIFRNGCGKRRFSAITTYMVRTASKFSKFLSQSFNYSFIFRDWRLPFDIKKPLWFIIAGVLQGIVAYHLIFFTVSVLCFLIEIYFLLISMSDDLRHDLHCINKMPKLNSIDRSSSSSLPISVDSMPLRSS